MPKQKTIDRVLPQHIAVIMDGSGRWAKRRLLPRSAGHSAGARAFKTIARYCNRIGLKYLTAYAFSTENWSRPPEEVRAIMDLLRDYLKDAHNFKEDNIQVKFIGDLEKLDADIIDLINEAEDGSKDATGLKLNIAVNYGGRDEILHAVRAIAADAKAGRVDPSALTEADISSRLYTAGQPDPDLIIRTSGEYRLSNYLIWQSAYAEFSFPTVLWPDFTPRHLEEALNDFAKRHRRFGGV